MLLTAAALISYFKSYHYMIGLLFISFILFSFYRSYRKKNSNKAVFWLSTFGVLFTLTMGLIAELWGTANGHWVYLGIPDNVTIPFWVPFAWGLAYKALYRVESILLRYFTSTVQKWIFCVALPAMVFPVIGEIFVIYFGTWRYNWLPQFLGMPLLPVLLLGVFHVSIFYVMCKICQHFAINDPVYGSVVKIEK